MAKYSKPARGGDARGNPARRCRGRIPAPKFTLRVYGAKNQRMNRQDIDRLLVQAKLITNHPDFVIIGSRTRGGRQPARFHDRLHRH